MRNIGQRGKATLVVGLFFLLSLGIVVLFAPGTQAAEVIRWKGQSIYSSSGVPYGPFKVGEIDLWPGVKDWSEWLTRATGGRLVIEWAEPNTIFPSADSDTAVGKGVVDISACWGGYYSARIPEAAIESGIPFGWENVLQEYESLYRYGLFEVIQQAYLEKNIVWFPRQSSAWIGITTTFPAPNSGSIKGKKIRAPGSWGEYIKMLGGVPTNVPVGEMYMGMKLGTFDGVVGGSAFLQTYKLKEVAKGFVYQPPITTAMGNYLISKRSFDRLPKDIQDILMKDARYAGLSSAAHWDAQCTWVLKNAEKEYGIKMYAWSPEDIAKVTKMTVEQLFPKLAAPTPRCARMIEIIKAQMKDMGRID